MTSSFNPHIIICDLYQTQRQYSDMKYNRLQIRPYLRSDEKDVLKLWHECNLIVPWNNPKLDIERKLKVNPELFLVGLFKGKVVATVMGGYEGHRGWINYLAVSVDHQRKGFGKQIMTALEDKLKASNCPKINLQVRVGNIGTIKFYESLNYSNDHVISMGKRLKEDPGYNTL